MRTDLHIHTNMSDGRFSPSQVIRMGASAGLEVMAVADHNTIAGLLEARRVAREHAIRLIPAVELATTLAPFAEVHILGYGFEPTNAALVETFEHVRQLKRRQIHRIVERLGRDGIRIDFEDVVREAQSGYLGRQHLARVMSRKGAMSHYDIFQNYIGAQGRAYVPLDPFPPEQAIAAIVEAGGMAVLAHPGIELIDHAIKDLAGAGLGGIEVFRPPTQGSEQLYLEMVAEDFGLLMTGGSDWHGFPGDGPLGQFYVRSELIAPFLERVLGGA
jgi:predicted metal-dependent phosphoesterase TrpH